MSTIERLQRWYHSQCDGEWEHSWGARIGTLDNPGWAIDVNVEETVCENEVFDSLKIERSDTDWIYAFRENMTFKVRCGPGNLEEGLLIFLDWADKLNERAGQP